ncbi:MAG: hypothetical protein JRJ78_15150 [Deltaproteobacteria bacterium]|nr:hypothetical protein [Deltaproteobacteria bacterium]
MRRLIGELRERVRSHTETCEVLTEDMIWRRHGTLLWKARKFEGSPVFYPVYRCGELYSYSVLALILHKGFLNLNGNAVREAEGRDFMYLSGLETIDTEIVRLGGPHRCGFGITDTDEYARRIARALVSDVGRVEKEHPGYTNIVLCGGRDSMNLLLLPWKNPTVAASAEPNHRFVRRFISENDLGYRLIHLEDPYEEATLDREILENCCRADLAHWRWGVSLKRLSDEYGRKVLFWKGQVADLYTTSKWKVFMHRPRRGHLLARKVYRRLGGGLLPQRLNRAIGRRIQPGVIRDTWDRCAMLQGCHMGFIREIADCLVLSAYHGPEVVKVFEEADLASVSREDMRDRVGRILHGEKVRYPPQNPAPPVSRIRVGLESRSEGEYRGLRGVFSGDLFIIKSAGYLYNVCSHIRVPK